MKSLRVCIDVDDLDRGIAFYTAGLGLTVGRRAGGAWAELLGASSPIDLLAKRRGTSPADGVSATRDYHRHWTPVHLDFVVDRIDDALARAVAHGARVERPVRDELYGRIALLADPFGHGLCLLEMSERGYDTLLDGDRDTEEAPT